tara:strand:+ start:3071 stop:3235 length:165 start_codon:yes stop_codon:yes gene_type:complete
MVNQQNQKLWLKWNTVLKKTQHLKFSYAGTKDKEIIEDMIQYIKILMERLKKDE